MSSNHAQKVIRIGNLIGVILPKVLTNNKLKVGDIVTIERDSISDTYFVTKGRRKASSVTIEFYRMLKEFNDKHKDVLAELANR